jgi:Cyclophilin type peptidyl-prolyl cis-trans isomerase/CLD
VCCGYDMLLCAEHGAILVYKSTCTHAIAATLADTITVSQWCVLCVCTRCLQVIEGMDIVRKIEEVPTNSSDKPDVPVVIEDCGELKE